MTILGSAYHEVALANSRLRTENERLRAALEEISKDCCFTECDRWKIRDKAREALAKEGE